MIKIKYIIYASLILLLVIISSLIIMKFREKKLMEQKLAYLPDFSFKTLDDQSFSRADLERDKKTILIFFSPDCEPCRYEINEFKSHYDSLDNAQVLFISHDPKKEIERYVKEENLDQYSAFKILHDPAARTSQRFGISGVPCTYIYDEQTKLVKAYRNELSFDAVYSHLR